MVCLALEQMFVGIIIKQEIRSATYEIGGGIIECLVFPLPKSEAVTVSKNWGGKNNGGLHLLVQWQLSPNHPFIVPR